MTTTTLGDAFGHSSEVDVVGRSNDFFSNSSDDDNNDGIDGEDGESDRKESNSDPYRLQRFVKTQKKDFSRALAEIRRGRKASCWMWYVIPTAPWVVKGVERGSYTNRRYALRDLPPNEKKGDDAARAYLSCKYLRKNYIKIVNAIADQLESGNDSISLMGVLDAPKLKSSLELFKRIAIIPHGDFPGNDFEVRDSCARVLRSLENEKSTRDETGRHRRRKW